MKTQIKITRSNFPNQSMLYWMNYFINILKIKYDVVIDNQNPDLVFWTNIYSSDQQIDLFTGELGSSHTNFPNAKKIFCSCEISHNLESVINFDKNYFVIGPDPIINEKYLRLPIHNTTAAWGLYDESKIFSKPYDWLTEKRDGKKILESKKHFCGVVQNSSVGLRQELFDKLSNYKFVRASGMWKTNVPQGEETQRHINDGLCYKSKIEFLKSCKFSFQIQSNVHRYLTVEKLIHGYAAETIPIYHGNDMVLEDGFNPNSFINIHDYQNTDEVVSKILELDQNDELFIKMIEEPIFIGNVLPDYFNPEYLLSFFDKVIKF